MEAARTNFEPEKEAITKEEAARMIDLWTRLRETEVAPILSLHDVKDVLQISDAEARELLARVRKPATRIPLRHIRLVRVLFCLSLMFSAFFVASCLYRAPFGYVSENESKGAVLAALWVLGCGWYYRRPVLRAVRFVITRFVEGRA